MTADDKMSRAAKLKRLRKLEQEVKELKFLLSLSDIERTRFLQSWVERIYNETKPIDRQQEQRKDILLRNKRLLALAKAVGGKVNLREFAEVFGESYETVRKWAQHTKLMEETAGLEHSFCLEFIQEIIRLHETACTKNFEEHNKANEQLSAHLQESQFYHQRLKNIIIAISKLESTKIPEHIKTSIMFSFYVMLGYWNPNSIYNPPKLLEDKKKLIDELLRDYAIQRTLTKYIFQDIKDAITNNNISDALLYIEMTESKFNKLEEHSTDMQIEYLMKGMKKQEAQELEDHAGAVKVKL